MMRGAGASRIKYAAIALAAAIVFSVPSFALCGNDTVDIEKNYSLSWTSQKYAKNFVSSFFPPPEAVMKMNIWGFFYLWGLVSFIENNIPEGLDGAAYALAVKDLRKDIEFLKKDMLYLLQVVWGARKIDREIINVQLFNITYKLNSIISTIQKVRANLIKPSYFLFSNSLDQKAYINNGFDFSVSLNYLSVDSIWSEWFPRENIIRELDFAKKTGVNTVKIGIYLDYWVNRNTSRINDIREILTLIRARGFKIFINFLGVRGWYGEDMTFKPRSGRTFGAVNFITWRYHCEQAIAEIVKEFKPEYATVIREPMVDFQEQVSGSVPVELWLDCFSTIASETAINSPGTIVVLENGLSTTQDFEIFKNFQEIKPKNVAFGALIYSLKDIFSYNQYVKMCRVRKNTIIAEFWDSVALYVDEYAEDFIALVFRWALNRNMQLINLSYIVNLHTIDFSPTPAFFVYKNIIAMAFMEGMCKKGIKSNADGICGTLYSPYLQSRVDYKFRFENILRSKKN